MKLGVVKKSKRTTGKRRSASGDQVIVTWLITRTKIDFRVPDFFKNLITGGLGVVVGPLVE